MKQGNKKGSVSKLQKILYYVTAVSAAVLIIFMGYIDVKHSSLNQSKLQKIELEGVCYAKGSKEILPLSEENLKDLSKESEVILEGSFSQDIEKNEQIFVYLRRIEIEMFQNGKLIYSYGAKNAYPKLMRSAGNVWGSFYSDGIKKEDSIKVVLHNPYRNSSSKIYEMFAARIFVGDRMQLFLHMVKQNIWTVLGCGLVFFMGTMLLMIALTLRVMRVEDIGAGIYGGMLFIVSALWLLIDYSYISLIFPFGMMWDTIDTLILISIPTLGLHYAEYFMITRAKWVAKATELFLLCGSLLYIILQACGIIDGEMLQEIFLDMLPFIEAAMLACLALELRKNRNKNAYFVLIPEMILVISASISYFVYKRGYVYSLLVFGVGVVIFSLIQYLYFIRQTKESYMKARKAREMEQELIDSRISIMLSQIQPHFLYNSISCIQELCMSDPKKAYDAMAQFAHFLRGNMDSLSSTHPIPFEQELRHVKNYLALEVIRFEDRLKIVYNIQTKDFLIPALTIQPIVENAVRYGISKKKCGGTVTISTQEKDGEIVVSVFDDGVGFDIKEALNKQDGRSHIGIENVKKRLWNQCCGRMEISSNLGIGTLVNIYLPKGGMELGG